MAESACAGAGCELVLRACSGRNPWLIGPVINGISYSPGMPAQPSLDGLGFFFDNASCGVSFSQQCFANR
jgi:hypothetical protein